MPAFFCEENKELLRRCGISNNKIRTLCAIRRAWEDGNLSPRRLRRVGAEDRSRQLQGIWGIGPWTADMANIFYFLEPDVWPQGDLAVRKTFARFVVESNGMDPLEAAKLFVPHRSFLAIYMWRVVARDKL